MYINIKKNNGKMNLHPHPPNAKMSFVINNIVTNFEIKWNRMNKVKIPIILYIKNL